MAAVDGENTTTNQKLVPAAEKTLENARDRDGTYVGGILLRLGRRTERQKQTQIKIRRGLRWPNNEPKTSGIDGEEIFQDERTTGGAGEARVDHFWGE